MATGTTFTTSAAPGGGMTYTASAPGFTPATPYTPPAVPASKPFDATQAAILSGIKVGSAPAGSMQSASGNWVDAAGNQYTQAPGGTPPTEPAVLSSTNVDQTNQQNVQKAAGLSTSGQSVGQEGFVRNADLSFAEAPSDAVQTQDASGNISWTSGGLSYALGPSGGKISQDPATQAVYDQLTALKGQMDATGASNIENIKQQYASLIQDQEQANAGAQASTYSLLARGGSLQTGSSAGIINAQVSYGVRQIADLNTKENAAIIAAQQAMQTGDYQILDKQLSIIDSVRKDKQDAAQKLSDTISAGKAQAAKDTAIANVLSSGVTDPAEILKTLQSQGNTTISAKDIADTLSNLNPDAKNIMSIMQTATENGAPKDVLAAIGKAKTYSDALQAGQGWISTNADVQEYNTYRSQATTAGQTPVSFDSWQSNRKYLDAYATAQGTAAGKAALTPGEGGISQSSIKSKSDIPQNLKPYVKQSADGTWYMDLSSASAAEKDRLTSLAGDLPVITDKNQSADLANIRDVNSKLKTVASIMSNINSASALSRALGGAGYTAFSATAQTDPKAAAAGALNDIALDVLKSISGVQGFRGNATAVQQVKDSLPKITDTQDTAAQKLDFVAKLISDRETGILGQSGPTDYTNFTIRTEDQAQKALISASKGNTDMQDQVTKILGETNPDTNQPYTYLEAAQILGIDIPALQGLGSPGIGSAGQSL